MCFLTTLAILRKNEYRQDKDDSRSLANKIADFEVETKTMCAIRTVLITTWGLWRNVYPYGTMAL